MTDTDTNTSSSTDDEHPAATELDAVHADPVTGLYHATGDVAGDHAIDYTRRQADLAGFDPCPTCYWGTAAGEEVAG